MKTAQDHLGESFSLYGYQVLETPLLEPTELFLRKSGGELAARMYTFTDPGGNQVSLRPEYTASIVRHYLEKAAAEPLPMRVQYAGPVFRYEGDGNSYRQFTQMGAELLGSSSTRADAEILSLSFIALTTLGLKGHRLELGDLGVLHQLLESLGLSERAVVFILGSIAELKTGREGLARVRERASQLRLLPSDRAEASLKSSPSYLGKAIGAMGEEEARELLHGLLQWAEAGPLGARQPSEVVERLLRKFRGTDDPARLELGLEVAHILAGVRGEPGSCLTEADRLIHSQGLKSSALDRLKGLIELLEMEQLDGSAVVLDFGLARGLAYYTGIVFEIKHPAIESSLGGGGRYDGLARALGSSSNVPALGFAYSLETVLDALECEGKAKKSHAPRPAAVLVLSPHGKTYMEAMRLVRELRNGGTPVEVDVCGMSLEESLSYASARGILEVIAVDGKGESTTYRV